VLLVALAGCGGAPTPPPQAPKPPPAPKPAPVVETADLSPVAAPPGLFVVGRLQRPLALTDALAHWAGVPVGLRDIVPLAVKDFDAALAWEAPLELAVAVAPSGSRGMVEAAVSVGLTSTEQALTAARREGYELKRLGPEIYGVAGPPHMSCAIAPAIGSALARLVCAHRSVELEDLLPYMTRGLPNAALGQHDLEVELRVEPLRQRFASEIGSARLFAGFLVRELQLDAPRFDTALSDTAYALADELVALVHDVDLVHLEATVNEERRELDADLSLTFGDHKSWTVSAVADRAKHEGAAPEKFFAQPSDATSGGYYYAHDPALYERMSAGLVELADAYLEHAKVAKPARERVARLIQTYFRWDGAGVTASGTDTVEASKKGEKSGTSDWMVLRADDPPPTLKGLLADLAGILADREARSFAARTFKVEDKELPSGRLVPLTGPGIPAGTRALMLKTPTDLGPLFGRSFGLSDKPANPHSSERAFTVVMSGPSAVIASAESTKVLAARLGQALSGKGLTLATRSELEPLRAMRANWGAFSTLMALLGSLGHELGDPNQIGASLPHHGQVPMFLDFEVEPPTGASARWRLTVPASVFEDLTGLAPLLAGSFLPHSGAVSLENGR
jgi:hypothetical protein